MRVFNAAQMREADRRTTDDIGIPSVVLMENAGRQVVAAMDAAFEDADALHYAILCGRGQNGGDGYVVARVLRERGSSVAVFLVGRSADIRGDAAVNLRVLANLSIDVVEVADAAAWELHAPSVLGADVVVDALVGTGLRDGLTGLEATIVEDLNDADTPVVAVDLPSGLRADTPAVRGPAVVADLTVTFGAPKLPQVLPPAEDHVGRLVVADIGIPATVIERVEGPWIEILTRDMLLDNLEPRPSDSHKGDYGRVLIVGGSPGMTGAPVLAARAALRAGAGLVTIAAPRACRAVIASMGAECMTLALEDTQDGGVAVAAVDTIVESRADVIVIGPGLGRSSSTAAFVQAVVERAHVPLVIDADALAAFAGEVDRLAGPGHAPRIITPHPGEMAALLGVSVDAVQAGRLEIARDLAVTRHLYVVLKGHRTVLAGPDGRVTINLTGNPGMATGGTGDVLAGMIGSWCAQGHGPAEACRLGAHIHGLAGDLAAEAVGEGGMIASDVVDRIPQAVLQMETQA